MKIFKTIMLIGFLCLSLTVNAQLSLGITIGSNLTYYSGVSSSLFIIENEQIDASKYPIPGLDVSITSTYKLNQYFNLTNAIGYRLQGQELRPKFPAVVNSAQLLEHYLNFLIAVGYDLRITKNIRIGLDCGYAPALFLGGQMIINHVRQFGNGSHEHNGFDHIGQSGISLTFSYDFGELSVSCDYRKKLNQNVKSFSGETLDFSYESFGFGIGYSYPLTIE